MPHDNHIKVGIQMPNNSWNLFHWFSINIVYSNSLCAIVWYADPFWCYICILIYRDNKIEDDIQDGHHNTSLKNQRLNKLS